MAKPSPSPVTRCPESVPAAVTTKASAEARSVLASSTRVCTSISRTAMTHKSPASAASGMREMSLLRYKTASISTTPWTMLDRRVVPPLCTLTLLRTTTPVTGMPHSRPTPMLAMPWPNSSRLGLCGFLAWLKRSSALADSSDSTDASRAIGSTTSTRSSQRSSGSTGIVSGGNDEGIAPTRSISQPR